MVLHLAASKGSPPWTCASLRVKTTSPLSKRREISRPFNLPCQTMRVLLPVPSSPGEGDPWFRCSGSLTAVFFCVAGGSLVESGPSQRTRSTPSRG
ncbi:hypothetical protein T4D_15099 [Trichinella pseudospiralis]|uniref:Uncharacterized protein n=1 Tax=Trichinella pseudospiralis TaxID=6337 RepID=A0A0V1F670_TRIPS|nr:hypothetical protein T4D_15099 [Trichinella pseudospiralis]